MTTTVSASSGNPVGILFVSRCLKRPRNQGKTFRRLCGGVKAGLPPASASVSSLPGQMSIAALLLAAGQSRRMGAFKPLLPFGTRSVVEACVANLFAGGVDE